MDCYDYHMKIVSHVNHGLRLLTLQVHTPKILLACGCTTVVVGHSSIR